MIIFEKIRMKNFFSVGNTPLEINLNNYRKTLSVGTNGSGKSSCILDSIVFALYGKPFRKTNKPNLVNSVNKGNLVVEIEFSIGDRGYKVIRGIKPNIFEIYCNGSLVNQDAKSSDYQEYLEKYILKVNYKSFINVVILGSARYNPFMGMSAADRRGIIEELLDIQVFSTMNVLAKDQLSKIKEQLNDLKFNIELTNEKIELQKQNIQNHKNSTKKEIDEKKEEIERSKKQVEEIQKNVSLIQKHNDKLLKSIYDEEKVKIKKSKLLLLESKLEQNVAKCKKSIDFFQSNDNCPTCKQHIDISIKEEQIQINENKKNELVNGASKLNQELTIVKDRLLQIFSINEKIYEHNSETIRLNASVLEIQKYIQKEFDNIQKISEQVNSIEETDDKLNSLNDELVEYVAVKEELSTTKKYYDFCLLMLKDGGIKTRIIKQYLPIMNKLINAFLSQMNFFVNFNIDENFDEVIKSRHRDEFRYENFSEGEKLRIDLAILFAFRQIAKMKNSVNTNLMIFDETLDSALDLNGIEQFMDLIESLDHNTNVIVISHKGDSLGDRFDRTLKFDKKKNFTKLMEIR